MVYSNVKVRTNEADHIVEVKITSDTKPEIEEDIINKWQKIVDVVSNTLGGASCLVTHVKKDVISILLASRTKNNYFAVGDEAELLTGLYCETTIGTDAVLSIPNALKSKVWGENPHLKYSLIAYLGIPIKWPDGEFFGTICVFDDKENYFDKNIIGLIESMKDSIEKDLHILVGKDRLEKSMQYHIEVEKKIKESNLHMVNFKKTIKENEKLVNETLECEKIRNEFISNISHEFRTPLNVILSTIQLITLQHNKHGQYHYDIDKYLKSMKQNCFRLLRLVNNIIDITRIDSDYYEMNFVNTDVVALVKDITVSVASLVLNKGMSVKFDTDVEEKIIALDMEKIETIFLNLLSNAVKFSNKGDTIFVDIKSLDGCLAISIKDTGIGIPNEKHSVIFERFRQVDKSFIRNHEGSGIGLSLVKLLVEKHDGSISVFSEMGKGSEFVVNLPDRTIQDYVVNKSESNYYTNKGNYGNCIDKVMLEFSDIYEVG